MTSSPAAPWVGWRSAPLTRVVGSAASWFLFSLSFSLLFRVSTAVMSLGGSCASGGPYEIAVECPDNVAIFAPLSIFGGLIAVGISAFLAQGFGTPLTTWAWPVLFVGLGLAFLFSLDVVGLVIGVFFVIMGLVPIVLELRGSPQRVFLGQFAANGQQFYEGENARRSLMSPTTPNPQDAVRPTSANWVLAIGIVVIFAFLGYWVAGIWFTAVGTPLSR